MKYIVTTDGCYAEFDNESIEKIRLLEYTDVRTSVLQGVHYMNVTVSTTRFNLCNICTSEFSYARNIDGDYICIRGGKIYEVDNRDDGVFVGIALDDSDSISAVYKDYLDRLMYKSDSIRIVDDLKVNETWYRRLR